MPDVSVLLDRDVARPKPLLFNYRAAGHPGLVHSARLDEAVGAVTKRMTDLAGDGSAPAPAPAPPEPIIVTERTVPPAAEEPREFHAAMAKMLQPRRP